jgi:small conductance mechanosensitive channel
MEILTQWLMETNVIRLAGQLVLGVAILVIGRWLAQWITGVAAVLLERATIDITFKRFLEPLIYYSLLTVVFVVALTQMGFTTTALTALIASAGLAIGLALQGFLTNVAAGIVLLIFRPFRVGNYVAVAGHEGEVNAIQIINTVLTTRDNVRVVVPNAKITGDSITNYSAHNLRRVVVTIGISYGDDIRQARAVLLAALAGLELLAAEPAPVVAVGELADSSVNLNLVAFAPTLSYWAARGKMLEAAKIALDQAGITIPFPQRDVHLIPNPQSPIPDP